MSTFRKQWRLEGDQEKRYQEAKYNFLRKQIALYNKHGIKYMCDWGTCLGIVRENDLIKWDNDTDIQIFGETLHPDYFKDLDTVFWNETTSKAGYKKLFNKEDDYTPLLYTWLWGGLEGQVPSFKSAYGQDVKIFGCNMISYPYINGQRILRWPGWQTIVYDAKLTEELQTVSFKGFDVVIPKRAEEYVEYLYGETWKQTILNFGDYKCTFLNSEEAHAYQFSIKEKQFKIN